MSKIREQFQARLCRIMGGCSRHYCGKKPQPAVPFSMAVTTSTTACTTPVYDVKIWYG